MMEYIEDMELKASEPTLDEELDLDDEDMEEGVGHPPKRFLTDQQPDEHGLYEHYSITVDKGQSMMRLDKYLATHIENC